MRRLVAVAALLLLAGPASASLIEDTLAPANDLVEPTTGVTATYQEDGGVHGDAPDTCLEATADRTVNLDDARTQGMLMDVDDESDAYVFELSETVVGERVQLDLLAGLVVDRHDVLFDVQAPGCTASVFDYQSSYYDRAPADPYTPPEGSVGREAGGLSGYDCGDEWKFLANQMGGIPAPETIYVEWTDGSYEYVPVDKSTPATIAMYLTGSHPDVTVARAVIVVPADYTGEFNLVHGFCGAVQGTPELPPMPPTLGAKVGEFTVQEAGTHIVVVYIERGTVDKTVDTVEDLVNDPPTSVPLSCHTDICSVALAESSYDMGAVRL